MTSTDMEYKDNYARLFTDLIALLCYRQQYVIKKKTNYCSHCRHYKMEPYTGRSACARRWKKAFWWARPG